VGAEVGTEDGAERVATMFAFEVFLVISSAIFIFFY